MRQRGLFCVLGFAFRFRGMLLVTQLQDASFESAQKEKPYSKIPRNRSVAPVRLLPGSFDFSEREDVPTIVDSATDNLRALGKQLAHVLDICPPALCCLLLCRSCTSSGWQS
jgi:hypothetical protein